MLLVLGITGSEAPGVESSKTVDGKQVDDCSNSPTEADLLSCRQKRLAQSEQALALAVKSLNDNYRTSAVPRATLLQTSHRAWLAYRKAECKLQTYDSASGTAYEIYRLDCLDGMNRRRLVDLQSLLGSP
jgi:uncharacterized protein YecT (DUF1311 family)